MFKRIMSSEHQLVLLCTRIEITSQIQQEIKKIINSQINWAKLIEIAKRQDILPLLYYNLNKLNLPDIIPEDTLTEIKYHYYANLKRNLRIEKEIFNLLELINQAGISIIPFKGFELIQTLYPDPGLRTMVDVDILIKEADFEKVRLSLNQRGFSDNFKTVSKEYLEQHEIIFSKTLLPNLLLFIEIHCFLAPARPYKINLIPIWKRAQKITVHNQKLLSLSAEDAFLSLVLHLRRHTRRLTLKFIVDIAEWLNKNQVTSDWNYIKESSRNIHIISTVYCSLYLAKELLNCDVPVKILNEFRLNNIKTFFMRLAINKYNFFTLKKWQGTVLRLLFFDNLIDLFLYLWRISFLERFSKRTPIPSQEKIKK